MVEWLKALGTISVFIALLLTGISMFNLAQQIYNAPTISKQPIVITPNTIDIQPSENHTCWNIISTFDNTILKEGEMYYIRFVLPVADNKLPFSGLISKNQTTIRYKGK
ncbi:MAG: hypothetical protein WC516_08695 [Patescibacteria group bacterium]|jgi:hypothetical protein